MATNKTVNRILRNSGLSQEEFCQRVGERWSDFAAIRNGFISLKPDRIARWATALGKTSEELLKE